MSAQTAIVIGICSDIGAELARRFAADGWSVKGTYRGAETPVGMPAGAALTRCELDSRDSVAAAQQWLLKEAKSWDAIVVAAGTEQPIGEFWDCAADEWDSAFQVNALAPLRLLRALYPVRRREGKPGVAFFSGSGTNNAAPSYSAYCASKILLIKMCELLDAESPDASFFIVGPGIVRTKIHLQTLAAPDRSGANYRKVVDFLESAEAGTSHDDIYACIRWCMTMGKNVVGGRNISLIHDAWRNGGRALAGRLQADRNMYKLRRSGNEARVEDDRT
jgi:NAD(P)-dependent dehydrogenase (short-subunit alcohol dehydrogenase family)